VHLIFVCAWVNSCWSIMDASVLCCVKSRILRRLICRFDEVAKGNGWWWCDGCPALPLHLDKLLDKFPTRTTINPTQSTISVFCVDIYTFSSIYMYQTIFSVSLFELNLCVYNWFQFIFKSYTYIIEIFRIFRVYPRLYSIEERTYQIRWGLVWENKVVSHHGKVFLDC